MGSQSRESSAEETVRRARALFEAASALDGQARQTLLNRECGTDAKLRSVVEGMLDADRASHSVLDRPLSLAAADHYLRGSHFEPGEMVGPYRIIRELAVGGMGTVYSAIRADGQYRQQVALKVMRGEVAGAAMASRFRGERQILALLDHPNIARILDGGATPEGLPYFVMEWIDGVPVTTYCRIKKLTVEQRLELFRAICSAVQYAHQRLIVHRDIKPANILVTADGTPKLLDFGIAKILDPELFNEEQVPTVAGIWVMTPEHASPEQFRGEPVTTASDIYSLGLVLFELLTGRSVYHFPKRLPHEIARVVLETEPETPSSAVRPDKAEGGLPGVAPRTLQRRLAGDLDNIVRKALRKEPVERYQSVEQFADDIHRHLENLPIVARKDTAGYRTAKFVKRHKAGLFAAGLTALLLFIALGVTVYEARMAVIQRRAAEQRFSDLQELATLGLDEFSRALQNAPDSASAQYVVTRRLLGYLDKLSRDPRADVPLLRRIAAAYERIAYLQANYSGPGIGDSAAALDNYRKALSIRESLVARPNVPKIVTALELGSLQKCAEMLATLGKFEESADIARRELALAESSARRMPANHRLLFEEVRARLAVANAIGGGPTSDSPREIPEAITYDREAVRLLSQSPSEEFDSFGANIALAFHLNAQRQFSESLQILDRLAAAENRMHQATRDLPAHESMQMFWQLHSGRANVLDRLGNYHDALAEYRKALMAINPNLEANPHDIVAQLYSAASLAHIGVLRARLGSKAAGKRVLDGAVAHSEALLVADPHRLFFKEVLLIGYGYQAEALSSMDDQKGAERKYAQAIQLAGELRQSHPDDLDSQLTLGKLHLAGGVVLARERQFLKARKEIAAGQRSLEQLLLARPQDGEGLFARNLIRAALAGLRDCAEGRPCPAVRRLGMPNLSN